MSALVQDLQKQNPDSSLVILYEIELTSSSTLFFHSGENVGSTITFKSNGTADQNYISIPVHAEGFESGGQSARPQIVFANIESVFSAAAGADYNVLLGCKVTRRTTLKKYTKVPGNYTSNNPPEFPKDIYFIDRIASKTKSIVTFELAAAHDLEGIQIPARQIVAGACPWIYQGAAVDLAEKNKCGGCTWHTESKYKAAYGTATGENGSTEYTAYVNIDDEYIIPSSTTFTAYSSGAVTTQTYYKNTTAISATTTLQRLTKTGLLDSGAHGTTVNNYWQAVAANSSPGTPSSSNTNFNRHRIFSAYSSSITYYAYTQDNYNDYVTATVNGKVRLFKAKITSIGQPPSIGSEYWEIADTCSKTLTGCKKRYGFNPLTLGTASSTGNTATDTRVVLPFGGFPGAKNFR